MKVLGEHCRQINTTTKDSYNMFSSRHRNRFEFVQTLILVLLQDDTVIAPVDCDLQVLGQCDITLPLLVVVFFFVRLIIRLLTKLLFSHIGKVFVMSKEEALMFWINGLVR